MVATNGLEHATQPIISPEFIGKDRADEAIAISDTLRPNKLQGHGSLTKNEPGTVWLPWKHRQIRKHAEPFEVVLIRTRKNIGRKHHHLVGLT